MDSEPRFLVTVTFRSGAQARIRMSQRPTIPVTYHVPGTLFWIGDDDGPKVEVAGGELIDLDIVDIPATPGDADQLTTIEARPVASSHHPRDTQQGASV